MGSEDKTKFLKILSLSLSVVILILIIVLIFIIFDTEKDIEKETETLVPTESEFDFALSSDNLFLINECRAYKDLSEESCNTYLNTGRFSMEGQKYDSCIYNIRLMEIINNDEINRCQEITTLQNYQKYDDWTASICFLALVENQAQCSQFPLLNEYNIGMSSSEKEQLCVNFLNYVQTGNIVLEDQSDIYYIYLIEAIRNQEPALCERLTGENEIDRLVKINKCKVLSGYNPGPLFCDDVIEMAKNEG